MVCFWFVCCFFGRRPEALRASRNPAHTPDRPFRRAQAQDTAESATSGGRGETLTYGRKRRGKRKRRQWRKKRLKENEEEKEEEEEEVQERGRKEEEEREEYHGENEEEEVELEEKKGGGRGTIEGGER